MFHVEQGARNATLLAEGVSKRFTWNISSAPSRNTAGQPDNAPTQILTAETPRRREAFATTCSVHERAHFAKQERAFPPRDLHKQAPGHRASPYYSLPLRPLSRFRATKNARPSAAAQSEPGLAPPGAPSQPAALVPATLPYPPRVYSRPLARPHFRYTLAGARIRFT